MPDNKDLVKKSEAILSVNSIPGAEEIEITDIAIPRLRLLQDLSSEVKDKLENAVPGKIIHSITGEIFDEVEFIPLKLFKSRVMFDADNRSGAPLCISLDNKVGSDGTECNTCVNSKWNKKLPPECNQIYNYLVIFPGQVGKEHLPCIISFLRSSVKKGAMKLNAQVLSSGQPFWNMAWKLIPREEKFKKGNAFTLTVKQSRVTTKEEREFAQQAYNTFGNKKIDDMAPEHEEVHNNDDVDI